jgi:hypothetical protein
MVINELEKDVQGSGRSLSLLFRNVSGRILDNSDKSLPEYPVLGQNLNLGHQNGNGSNATFYSHVWKFAKSVKILIL